MSNKRRDSLTPEQRALYGRLGAAVARSRHRPEDLTAAARSTFLSRFETEARLLHPCAGPDEIARVAIELRRAHFTRLAIASSRARSARKAA
jgi:hypothetical protein